MNVALRCVVSCRDALHCAALRREARRCRALQSAVRWRAAECAVPLPVRTQSGLK